jgi:hypothetical protein
VGIRAATGIAISFLELILKPTTDEAMGFSYEKRTLLVVNSDFTYLSAL